MELSTPLKKILVGDDVRLNRVLIRGILKPSGCQIVEAGDGQQALTAVEQETFDAMLLDLQMPVMDGLEVVHWPSSALSAGLVVVNSMTHSLR
jgi:CheY-like chemotaxis protein